MKTQEERQTLLESYGELHKESDATFSRSLAPGVGVSFFQGESGTDDLLHLTRYGRIELTPEGWVRTGNIQCTFRKIK